MTKESLRSRGLAKRVGTTGRSTRVRDLAEAQDIRYRGVRNLNGRWSYCTIVPALRPFQASARSSARINYISQSTKKSCREEVQLQIEQTDGEGGGNQ